MSRVTALGNVIGSFSKNLAVISVLCLGVSSCQKKEATVVISETRQPASVDESIRLNVTSEERLGGQKPPPFSYDEIQDWTRVPGTPFRLLNFTFATAGEAYVSISSGGLLQNANRWLNQFGQEPLDGEALSKQERISLLGGEGVLLSASGHFAGGMGKAPADNWSLLGVLALAGEDQLISVKMIGPEKEVAAQKDSFLAFCKSLRLTEDRP